MVLIQSDKAKYNIKWKARVNEELKGLQVDQDFREHYASWGDEESIDGEEVGNDAPQLGQWILLANDPPFPDVLWLPIDIG